LRKLIVAGITLIAAGCSPKSAAPPVGSIYDITATDYAFQAPATVPAGRVAFRLVNKGKVAHELNIAQLKPGVSIDDYLKTIRKNESVRPLIAGPVGVAFARAGEASDALITTEVKEGMTLSVICIFRDSAGAERHYNMGMYTTVKGGAAVANAPVPQPATDTIIATDYAFQYPRDLVAGRHTFVFRNDGKMRHEINIDRLAPGVTLAMLQAAEKAGQDVGPMLDRGIGVLHVYGGESPKGELSFEIEPGREYLIGCYFKDNDKAPEHYSLGMFGSMRGIPKPTATGT
jgi:hypothetical protein